MQVTRRNVLMGGVALSFVGASAGVALAQTPSAADVRAIAQEAYIWGFPMVDSYRIQNAYYVNPESPEYRAPWNTLYNTARVYTPADTAVQTPNSDTPYSFIGVDLRAEPMVLTVPEVEKGRYYSLQFIDLYTFNFAYVGSRATGNGAGSYLLAGPGWSGEKPAGITAVIRSETEFAAVIYRTQLFSPEDIDNVIAVQAGYKAQPLSDFLGTEPPPPAPVIDFIAPLTPEEEKTSLRFFDILSFVLQFAPVNPVEADLRARFATIGIGPGLDMASVINTPELQEAVKAGMADAWATFATYKTTELDTGKLSSADAFGTREFLNGDYLSRFSGAVLGIYGNSKQEALYPFYFVDSTGEALSGANAYTLRFEPGQLPPVNAFWSATLYTMPKSLLYANPINRYLINSTMLPDLVLDADGGLTLYVQNASPGEGKEANWLPAPEGPFAVVMRLYWPKDAALDGTWKAPPLNKAS